MILCNYVLCTCTIMYNDLDCRSSVQLSGSTKTDDKKTTHTSRLAMVNIFETCLVVTMLFFICWVTLEVALFLYMIGVYSNLSGDHYTVGRLLVLVNSCLNPYVYSLRYREFKSQLWVLLGKKSASGDSIGMSQTQSTRY